MRWHGGGGDAARMRARGIVRGEGQEGVGFSLFCGSYLPARHCPTPLVSRYVVPVLSVSLFFFSSAASFSLSFLYFPHPHPPARLPACLALIRITVLFFALSLFFPPSSLFFLALSVSLYRDSVYTYI